jgi:zeaxanthin glucosyltransferase
VASNCALPCLSYCLVRGAVSLVSLGFGPQAVAIVSQTPKEFDLPGIPWPPEFHYAGPFFDDAGREPIPFPWEKLNGRPLVYASLGTLVNGMASIYQTILAAVGRVPEIQVVLVKGTEGEA